jgi:hypothetical protein
MKREVWLNLDGPVPCRFCGGAFAWLEYRADEPSEPRTWSGLCACGCEWDEVPATEPPTWRTYANDDRAVAALVAEVERLQGHAALLEALRTRELGEAAQLGEAVRALLQLVGEHVLVTPTQYAERADEVVELLGMLVALVGDGEDEA